MHNNEQEPYNRFADTAKPGAIVYLTLGAMAVFVVSVAAYFLGR